jgi:hypothetical protein
MIPAGEHQPSEELLPLIGELPLHLR